MIITPSAAAHKVSRAKTLVSVWSPWWHVYLSKCDFTYVYDESLSIMGSSSLVMTVGLEFIQSHDIMDIAISLEFALQQSLRGMDVRAQRYIQDNPRTRHDIIGLAQSLEINGDINDKFSSVPPSMWESIVTKVIDKSYLASYSATEPPQLPSGWMIPGDLGFEPGLTAEKYIKLLIEKNEQEEEEFFNPEDYDQSQGNTGDDTPEDQDGDPGDDEPEDGQSKEGKSAEEGTQDDQPQDPDQQDSLQPPLGLAEGQDGGSSSSNDFPRGSSSNQESSDPEQQKVTGPQEDGDTEEGSGSTSSTSDMMSQPPSPFRDSYEKNVEATNPEEEQDHGSSPVPLNSNPHEVESNDQDDAQQDPSTPDQMGKDLASVEHEISSDFDAQRQDDTPPSQDDQPHQNRGEEAPSSDTKENKVENPWGDDHPGDHKAPRPGQSQPTQASDLAAVEAELADQQDDSPTGTQEENESLKQEYQHLLDRMKNSSEESNLNKFDIPSKNLETSAVGLSAEEKSQLDKKIAEAIRDHAKSVPKEGGFTPGDSFIAWSEEKLRKSVVPWQKMLRRIITTTVARSQMTGQSDLSYAKANPNQQPDMPIMMGFVTYPPEVTVLVDSSPSMLNQKSKTMSEFAAVVQKIFIQYSNPIVMAAADNSVKYAIQSVSPAKTVMKNIGNTFDGSSATFGETLATIAKKGVKLRGRTFPTPDVLVVFTDCLFTWPFSENASLPYNYATVIVASTEPYEEVKDILPRWVKENKNFVYIPD